jgi:protein gp37
MSRNKDGHGTAIEWTHVPGFKGESWNPIRAKFWHDPTSEFRVGWHCEHVTEGCRNCYAERFNQRLGTGRPFKPGELGKGGVEPYLSRPTIHRPSSWKLPRAIFVCSMTDMFGRWITNAWLDEIFAVVKNNPRHIFICVTKRPERAREFFESRPAERPNVWLLTSIHDQDSADTVIPELLQTPGVGRYGISYEPALGPVKLSHLRFLDWVIAGGESGPEARPSHPKWFRDVRDQCQSVGTPFFFKQWGEWAPHEPRPGGDLGGDVRSGRVTISHPSGASAIDVFCRTGRNTEPGSRYMARVGKRAAGRSLDGREWSEFPIKIKSTERDQHEPLPAT